MASSIAQCNAQPSFTYTATGDLGNQRTSMLENTLHQRPRLGHTANHCYNLPQESFTYGVQTDKHGAVSDSMSWPVSYQSLVHRERNSAPRDYLAINREAVRAGLASSRELSEFRATHDIRKKPKAAKIPRSSKSSQATGSRLPPTVVYGLGTKPSTPIFEVISNKYQEDWLEQNLRNKPSGSSFEEQDNKVTRSLDTRSSLLRTYMVPLDTQSCWKIKRFDQKAQPCVDTFRNHVEKELAWRQHISDRIGRRGYGGQGIYEPAKF